MKKVEKEYKKLLDTSIVHHRKGMRQKMKEEGRTIAKNIVKY